MCRPNPSRLVVCAMCVQGTAAPGIATLDACKAACLDAVPKCGGILFVEAAGHCYRKGVVHVEQCRTDATFTLHALEFPLPPSPPLVPPSPPRRPVARGIAALNARFRAGRPSADLADVGVIMHREDAPNPIPTLSTNTLQTPPPLQVCACAPHRGKCKDPPLTCCCATTALCAQNGMGWRSKASRGACACTSACAKGSSSTGASRR